MVPEYCVAEFSPEELWVFNAVVRRDHPLRRAVETIDFAALRAKAVEFYSPAMGRPGIEPLLMIKLEMLMYRDRLSDRQVIGRAETDMAYRWFLGLPCRQALPDPSSLCYFRARLGEAGYRSLFQEVVGQAKQSGLLKERLRLTDCTHVIADIALPATLELLAQTRDRALRSAAIFDKERVAGERLRLEALRETTKDLSPTQRLTARITYCRELLLWLSELRQPEGSDGRAWQRCVSDRDLLSKLIAQCEAPEAGDRVRSAADPDARRGRHGSFYDGYRTAVLVDPDSEIVTNINVQPANSEEAANILALVREEEAAHGTDIQGVSIDGAGWSGPVLRELQDPDDLNINVTVPPPAESSVLFTAEKFPLSEDGQHVTCPAGNVSTNRSYCTERHATRFRFSASTCGSCPLLAQCMAGPVKKQGRTVTKNDYEAEYQQARAKSSTPEYAAVRREHPLVERKHAELMRQHGCRRARYRGLAKVRCQLFMGTLVMNIKRMVKLLWQPFAADPQLRAA